MARLRWITAGESHGPRLTAIVEGVPAGLALLAADVDADLARRQRGYGRGGRMKIETDRVEFVGGVRAARRSDHPSPCRSPIATTRTGSTECPPRRCRRRRS